MKKVSIAVSYQEVRQLIGMHKRHILKCQDRIDEVLTTNMYGVQNRFNFVADLQREIDDRLNRVTQLNKVLEKLDRENY